MTSRLSASVIFCDCINRKMRELRYHIYCVMRTTGRSFSIRQALMNDSFERHLNSVQLKLQSVRLQRHMLALIGREIYILISHVPVSWNPHPVSRSEHREHCRKTGGTFSTPTGWKYPIVVVRKQRTNVGTGSSIQYTRLQRGVRRYKERMYRPTPFQWFYNIL